MNSIRDNYLLFPFILETDRLMNPAYQPGPGQPQKFDEKVNVADLPPTTEHCPSAPMPDDLPSYSEYMGKFSTGPGTKCLSEK